MYLIFQENKCRLINYDIIFVHREQQNWTHQIQLQARWEKELAASKEFIVVTHFKI